MTAPLSDERLAELRDLSVQSCSGDAPYNPDIWTLETARRELVAEVERVRAVVARVRDMHWRFDIYEICGCREHEGDTVTLADGEVVCRSGFAYSICHECCAPGDSQTEECVDNHDHSECWPCPTRKALDEMPALAASPA